MLAEKFNFHLKRAGNRERNRNTNRNRNRKMKTKSGKTLAMTDIRRAYRRTRQRENAALCKKYGTASSITAHYHELVEINKRMKLSALCRQIEAATVEGDFALAEKLSRQIQKMKQAIA